MPFKFNAARRHRIPKARYRVRNWPQYEGDLTLWIDPAGDCRLAGAQADDARRSGSLRCLSARTAPASPRARSGAFSIAIRSRAKKAAHAREQQWPDVARRRQAWFDAQPDLDPEHLVFIDESGASTKMARVCGRARPGQRCRAAIPHGHWKTTTFVSALRLSGMTAPMVLDGPMTGPAFLAYVQQVLAPTLDANKTVIMDNLPAHKVAGVCDAI